jgi:hypothetical protein
MLDSPQKEFVWALGRWISRAGAFLVRRVTVSYKPGRLSEKERPGRAGMFFA